MTESRLDRFVDGALLLIGVGALALALVLVVAPSFLPVDPIGGALSPIFGNPTFVILGAGGLAALATYHVVVGADRPDGPSVSIPTPPSAREPEKEVSLTGDWVDDRLAKVAGEEEIDSRVGLAITKKRIRERVTEVAVEVLVDTTACSRRRAHEKLSEGSWTDRPRAKVFLGNDDVPDLPLSVRIRDWASGEAFERQVTATVEELAEMAGVELERPLAPEQVSLEDFDVGEDDTGGWRPESDAREEDPLGEEFDPDGLYRREMFENDELSQLGLDQPGSTEPATDSSPGEEFDRERTEVAETGGERT